MSREVGTRRRASGLAQVAASKTHVFDKVAREEASNFEAVQATKVGCWWDEVGEMAIQLRL